MSLSPTSTMKIAQVQEQDAVVSGALVSNKTTDLSSRRVLFPVTESSFGSMPPLEQVTVCSTCEGDDDDLSSVSSHKQDEGRRSIFTAYWDKNQEEAGTVPCSKLIVQQRQLDDKPLSSNTSYEDTLKQTERPRRRRIFGTSYTSESALPLTVSGMSSLRKTRSTSYLASNNNNKQPRASCLRPSRYSGEPSRESSDQSESSAVSFCEGVDVVVFRRPTELWAADGWSDWFA